MIKRVSNREAGNIWAGWIIANLVECWPKRVDIDLGQVITTTNVTVKNEEDELDVVLDLIRWLVREKYISVEGIDLGGGVHFATVTKKSLALLNEIPPSLNGKKLGDAMIEAAKDIGKESAKSSIADLFGQFLGGIVKSVGT